MTAFIFFTISTLTLANVSSLAFILLAKPIPFSYSIRLLTFILQHLVKYGIYCYCRNFNLPESKMLLFLIAPLLFNGLVYVVLELVLAITIESGFTSIKADPIYKDILVALFIILYFIMNFFEMLFGLLLALMKMVMKFGGWERDEKRVGDRV